MESESLISGCCVQNGLVGGDIFVEMLFQVNASVLEGCAMSAAKLNLLIQGE